MHEFRRNFSVISEFISFIFIIAIMILGLEYKNLLILSVVLIDLANILFSGIRQKISGQ